MVKTVQEPAQSKAAGGLVLGSENIKGTFVGFIRRFNLYVVFWNADQHDRAIVIHRRSKRMDIVAEMPLTFETAHRLALFMPRAVPTTTLRRMRRQSNEGPRGHFRSWSGPPIGKTVSWGAHFMSASAMISEWQPVACGLPYLTSPLERARIVPWLMT
ncbi:hypothetical protein BST63_00705 [Bradyrhizobium canariense]|uniref:Uncharacterized protein n=2 Tax=Bradyrhizobium canariense TaxID=255045 RepID=A0A1X3GUG2_9BRAD|nr:hypothetical protein BSZ22_01585 [Bradyrhizobium canariense]OSI82389.1 hypothetical protein BSZ23_01815 [Bradyrhizobium canariense]OSI96763.1 hypothetical protein BSZ25_01460 [Bradyrhizobium canariense]OSI98433.1 hypothetical protein BSZ24_01420 [Bradyrhizobium canariense]OSJ16021.1 hypothetical protein BSZ16_01445 [Bradyrhizobium canariense]